MTGKERVEIALRGGRPDLIPIVPIHDYGYIMKAAGRDPREWTTASSDDRTRFIEEGLRLHPEVDGYFVHSGTTDDWVNAHRVEKLEGYWRGTHTGTGEQSGLLPDGNTCTARGEPLPRQGGDVRWEASIRSPSDIPAVLGRPATPDEIEASGRFRPLAHLALNYPDLHFSFQTTTPMVGALGACGGFAAGLTTMATDPTLFGKILYRIVHDQCARLAPAREAGAKSTWFTSYYTGADTISPRHYAELIFPYEREICEEARRCGFSVLNWYLGDLMPNLDRVMQLPIDALLLEQGRKGYVIDPVEIRRRVGPKFCLFGFGHENDYCTFNRDGLTHELRR